MVEDVDHINAYIFKLRRRLGTLSTLEREQLIIVWGSIKLIHDIMKYLIQSLTTTLETLGQRCDKSNNQASDAENNAF